MKSLSFKLGFIVITSIFVSFFLPSNILASNVLLYEDFDDGDANDGIPVDWEESTGDGSWIVNNGKYIGIATFNGSYMTTLAGENSWSDYSLEVDVTGQVGVDRHILFRFSEYHVSGYSLKYRENSSGETGLIELQKHGQNVVLQTNYGFLSHTGETHRFRIEAKGNRILVFADGNDEPLIDYTDTNEPILNGKVGFIVEPSGIGLDTVTQYDNLVVENLNVPLFDLPFQYPGRPNATQSQFQSAFGGRLTAAFDHQVKGGTYIPFTGNTYKRNDCPNGTLGITCYDSHNGTDFTAYTNQPEKNMIYSIGEGTVAYTSAHTENSCTPNNGGYGCVVVVHYPDQEVYALYAHLSQIQVNENEQVTTSSVIGVMGDTGCGKCGKHLHLGVLKPLITTTPLMKTTMTKKDWEHLVYQMKPNNSDETKYKSQCTYTAPNGLKFTFQDPTGWTGTSLDPWSLSSQEGGCGVSSPYLWKHQI